MPDLLISVLFVLSVAAVAVGAGLVYFPAGLIVGGGLTGGLLLLDARGSRA
jgi:hypothetical protein